MATILRVKRKVSSEAAESLLICCKRRKRLKEEGDNQEGDTEGKELGKFAFTISDAKDDTIIKHVDNAIRKDEMKLFYKSHKPEYTAKIREAQKAILKEKRYTLVAKKRALTLSEEAADDGAALAVVPSTRDKLSQEGDTPEYLLYDIELEENSEGPDSRLLQDHSGILSCNDQPMVREKLAVTPYSMDKYVYDIYYIRSPDLNFREIEDYFSIQAYTDTGTHSRYRAEDADSSHDDDDDDSNDEDNWRNDYPDEDPEYFDRLRNEEIDYYYGDDIRRGFGSDNEDELGSYFDRQLAIDEYRCHDDRSSDEEDAGCGGAAALWSTRSGYDSYKARILKDYKHSGRTDRRVQGSDAQLLSRDSDSDELQSCAVDCL